MSGARSREGKDETICSPVWLKWVHENVARLPSLKAGISGTWDYLRWKTTLPIGTGPFTNLLKARRISNIASKESR